MSGLFDLTGKVALITGSSRGIGRAIAMQAAEHGAHVVISSRKLDACEVVAESINSSHPGHAIALRANVCSKQDLEQLVAQTLSTFGKIDVLVVNAASNIYFGPMAGISDEVFRKTLESNLLSAHWLVTLVGAGMIEQRDGSIVLVSSVGGLRGSKNLGAYNVTKAADMQLARNLAVELGPHNVRVNCIAPGLVKTQFSRALWDDPQNLARALSVIPLGRIGEADDIAGAAIFLASAAGRYVNGETIVVDGGLTVAAAGI